MGAKEYEDQLRRQSLMYGAIVPLYKAAQEGQVRT